MMLCVTSKSAGAELLPTKVAEGNSKGSARTCLKLGMAGGLTFGIFATSPDPRFSSAKPAGNKVAIGNSNRGSKIRLELGFPEDRKMDTFSKVLKTALDETKVHSNEFAIGN